VQRRDVVVIGASAGGIQALREIVQHFPADFPGSVFVVVHIPASNSALPEILSRWGLLPAVHPTNGETIVPGRIYVAPPDYHLLVRTGWIELSHGPRENHSRPAVDPLFRSAARAFGARVVGVVLSGALDDGSVGLLSIKSHGGLAIVQDPNDAINEGMPRNALQMVDVDLVLPAQSIVDELVSLAGQRVLSGGFDEMDDNFDRPSAIITEDFIEQASGRRNGKITPLTCPDCGGTLWQTNEGTILRFQCHVGHAYNGEVLLGQKSEEVEAALWASIRLLRERATLSRQLADRMRESGDSQRAARIAERARLDEDYERSIHGLLESNLDPLAARAGESVGIDDER
jgi:two-component system, chemotaxis family, protein-glutamate methylesterase/glutaminase